MEETFGVAEIARFTRVAERVVRKWLDSGRMVGVRCPVTLQWKVARSKMLIFMREHGMVIPECFSTPADAIQSRPGAASQYR